MLKKIVIAGALTAVAACGPTPVAGCNPIPPALKCVHAGQPGDHTYHPDRLRFIRCATVTGVIVAVRSEADGDNHVLMRLDRPFSNMINPVNVTRQKGALVLEPECQHAVTQADAKSACPKNLPPVVFVIGARYSVTGAYVTDLDHGWNEIHPLTSARRI
jgi:hypothetical protein